MTKTVLIANRGEIALRIIRTATELGYSTAAVYAEDDADSPHVSAADLAVVLPGTGPAAYLDVAAVLAAAAKSGADLIHPGYGFLSEKAEFARAATAAGRTVVGPDPELLEVFGDKSAARQAAITAGLPVPAATEGASTVEQIREFLGTHPGGIMLKALAGGGGRGIRTVRDAGQIEDAYRWCAAEARLGFGAAEVFAEEIIDAARHIEVQVVADGVRAVAVGDRDCSIQRRYQKLIEIAPAPGISSELRGALYDAAVRLCADVGYRGLATVEFLVAPGRFVFLEVNPRIQVEHTVTEAVTGLDLVALQFKIAEGAALGDLQLATEARGVAVQCRVNTETTGTISAFTPPSGPGVRVDTYARPGLTVGPRYDPLLAKVITHVHADSPAAALHKARSALAEFTITGVGTNIVLLQAILAHEDLAAGAVTTGWLDRQLPALVGAPMPVSDEYRPGEQLLHTPMAGTIVEAGPDGVVLEAMKMQHVLAAPAGTRTLRTLVDPGQVVNAREPVLVFVASDEQSAEGADAGPVLDSPRADLDEVADRHRLTRDEGRPEVVAKRHGLGRRTARENIADLVDAGSFVEYGALAVAAQRSRRSDEDLIVNTPADGLVAGLATIDAVPVAVASYDYTVLAGTQGMRNHVKTDRLFEVAARRKLPVVLFAEGGGGRPGDTDVAGMAGLDLMTFRSLAALNGRVPLVAIVSGRCFAGNAALAGACDVIVATPDANIGMGGPAMIEGGGLGVFAPEAIGPIGVQCRNGVVGLAAADEADAVALAKRYLSYFHSTATDWREPDPRLARHVVPQNRLRAYDVRRAIEAIVDVDSVLELRPDYGVGIVTALVRVHGVAYGVLANNSHHLGGAIDAEAADKAADHLTLCESFRLPVLALCDTPGFMVGPDAERDATVRRFSRMFIAGARLTVPMGMIVLRKGYGLGAMAMAGGSFHAPQFTVAWPTGEIGGMGLEGAVRLGFRKELAEIADPQQRQKLFDDLVAAAYRRGRALSAAMTFELDDVIDPADTRAWIARLPDG
ncbi:acetyl-CoA carboxylase family protein [[Mycobacterium] vasticus]|uniref:Carboxyl transferase domain-containing protein n=1 Tax=[Mycobacterium] vasticus TaxID=2875777 RepID=A0ABU5YV12_9MYCO|nr:carboxyl transferase domain-containing protein [Mycolicibacter sp. MYC017]MEB3068937.1 carboxyl transferase domain-containing protein [Mycolicibacter sp. MYC017]